MPAGDNSGRKRRSRGRASAHRSHCPIVGIVFIRRLVAIAQAPERDACGLSTIKSATGDWKVAVRFKLLVTVSPNGLFVALTVPTSH